MFFVPKNLYLKAQSKNDKKVQFKALPSNSPSLFPEDIFDKIPTNHPVRLVNQVVDNLDLELIIKRYKGGETTNSYPVSLLNCSFTTI